MIHFYIDESGDLGFSSKSSKYFVIAALLTKDTVKVKKCITKIRKERLKKKYKKIPELKFHNSDHVIRTRILQSFVKTDIEIAFVVLRKNQVYDYLRNKPNILYNFLCGSLIGKTFQRCKIHGKINIIVDRSLTRINRNIFDEYIGYRALHVDTEMFDPSSLEISHINSTQDKCLQAVDFIVGAIARKYNLGDSSYYDLIDEKIIIALDFFHGQQR